MRKISGLLASLVAVILTLGALAPAQAANSPALIPTFGTPQATAGGYAVQITNYDAAFTWAAITSNCGVAAVDSNGWVEITGLEPSTTVTLTVFTERSGYDDGSASISSSSSQFLAQQELAPGLRSNFGDNYAADGLGNLYFAWSNGGQIRLSKSADGGLTWNLIQSFVLLDSTTIFVSPRVTVGSGTKVAMTWQDGRNATTQVRTSSSLDGGANWSIPVTLATVASQWSRIGYAADDSLVVAWYYYNGSRFVVDSANSSDFGANWSTPATVSDPTVSSSQHNIVETLDGDLVLFWKAGSILAARKFDGQGGTWGPVATTTIAGGFGEFPAAAAPGGNAGFAIEAGSVANAKDIQYLTFDGTAFSSAVSVTAATGTYGFPRITYTDSVAAITWVENTFDLMFATSTSLTPAAFRAGSVLQTGARNIEHINLLGFGGSAIAVSWIRNFVDREPYALEAVISIDHGATWGSIQGVNAANILNYTPLFMANSRDELALLWRVQTPSSGFFMKSTSWAQSMTLSQKELYLAAEMEAGPNGSSPYSAVTYNGKLYYSASTAATGRELFSFDGTNVELVADLNPGSADGLYSSGGVIGVFNNRLFLKGDNGTTGFELYAYDGTSIELIADVTPGPSSNLAYIPDNLVYFNNLLFFSGQALGVSESRGYVYDFATETFTDMRDHFAGYTKRNFWDPVVFQGDLYFRATEPGFATQLVKYDGATFTDIPTGGDNVASGLVVFGDKIVYRERDADGIELWSFDGTTASKVADLNPGPADSFPSTGKALGGRYYFTARTPDATSGQTDNELWVWDGLTAPTKRHDFFPNNPSASMDTWGWPSPIFAASNGNLYFSAKDATHGNEFREFSPCQAEPTLAADLVAGSQGSGNPQAIGELDGTIYVGLSSTDTGVELYAYGTKPAGFQTSVFVPDYTITYDPNGGAGAATLTAPAGSVTLSAGTGFEMTGKVLLGWDTDSTATTPAHAPSTAFTLSANVILFAIWGDPVAQTPGLNPDAPSLDLPNGPRQAASGGDVEIEGSNLDRVNRAEVDSKDAEIKRKSAASLTLGLPELEPGLHDLTLSSDFGRITIQGAIRVIGGIQGITPEAQSRISAWTKVNESKTEVRMYARGLVGAGKVQFFVDGVEVAWVRAADESDPKLRVLTRSGPMAGVPYLMRTVSLNPGKNRFEIRVDGVRVWRATYLPQR